MGIFRECEGGNIRIYHDCKEVIKRIYRELEGGNIRIYHDSK